MSTTVTKKPNESAVEIRSEIPAEKIATYRSRAIKELGGEVSIDGFRKGSVPENILIKHVGEPAILERIASLAISEELPQILANEKIIAIETPKVTITKLAPGNPIEFTALVTVMPEVTLPDYKAIAKKHNSTKEEPAVSGDEVAEMTRHLRRERARIDKIEKGTEPELAHEETQKLTEEELPEIDDAFAQSLGAKDTADLTARMSENMGKDKERRAQEKVRLSIIEDIIEKTPMTVPNVLIEHEIDRMLNRLSHDIEQSGSTLEAYFKNTGKTLEDMRKEWREAGENRARMQIAVHEIATKENIKAPDEDIARELEHAKKHNPNIKEHDLRNFVIDALLPEAVLRWLEAQK
jgi:trigger factor